MIRLAEGMERLGTETAFEVLARAEALKAQGKDIVNLGIGQPDFRTPDRKSTRLNSSHIQKSRMPSSA